MRACLRRRWSKAGGRPFRSSLNNAAERAHSLPAGRFWFCLVPCATRQTPLGLVCLFWGNILPSGRVVAPHGVRIAFVRRGRQANKLVLVVPDRSFVRSRARRRVARFAGCALSPIASDIEKALA